MHSTFHLINVLLFKNNNNQTKREKGEYTNCALKVFSLQNSNNVNELFVKCARKSILQQ